MVEPSEIERLIRNALPEAEVVQVIDLTGTKDHFQLIVVSKRFENMSRLEQHKTIYEALGDLMKGPIHALTLKTYCPDSWKRAQSQR